MRETDSSILCFLCVNRMFLCRKTYVSQSGNVGFRLGRREKELKADNLSL